MNILIASTIATARNESLHETLTAHHLTAQKQTPNAGGTNGKPDEARAAKEAEEAVLEFSKKPFGPAIDALKDHLVRSRALTDQESRANDLVAMVQGARQEREQLDELEMAAARAARIEGVSIRALANAAGISERNAIKRYKQIPGEGLSSISPH